MFTFGEWGSNPLQQKKETTPYGIVSFSGGEQGIRTLEQGLARYTISNRAPSTNSDNSPYIHLNAYILYIIVSEKSIPKSKNFTAVRQL